MLKIGEFSKLSRVSVRMLRHYDEIGLLKPAEIDTLTDYRYYREDQLPTAGRIAALKDMGFSLADIVRILEVYDDRKKLEKFFSARQEELERSLQETRECGDDGVEDREGELSRYGACEVPHTPGGYGCKLYLPGKLHTNYGRLCRCHCVDGGEWI